MELAWFEYCQSILRSGILDERFSVILRAQLRTALSGVEELRDLRNQVPKSLCWKYEFRVQWQNWRFSLPQHSPGSFENCWKHTVRSSHLKKIKTVIFYASKNTLECQKKIQNNNFSKEEWTAFSGNSHDFSLCGWSDLECIAPESKILIDPTICKNRSAAEIERIISDYLENLWFIAKFSLLELPDRLWTCRDPPNARREPLLSKLGL